MKPVLRKACVDTVMNFGFHKSREFEDQRNRSNTRGRPCTGELFEILEKQFVKVWSGLGQLRIASNGSFALEVLNFRVLLPERERELVTQLIKGKFLSKPTGRTNIITSVAVLVLITLVC
jgi:hypothetical protein